MLGRYLSRGLAGEMDLPMARRCLERARDAGVADAAADLARLPPVEVAAREPHAAAQ